MSWIAGIRHRWHTSIGLTVIMMVSVVAIFWCLVDLDVQLQRRLDVDRGLRNHLAVDELHDALRGGVLAVQYQSINPGLTSRSVADSFGGHIARMHPAFNDNKDVRSDQSPELHAVLTGVDQPLTTYAAMSGRLVSLISADPTAAALLLLPFEAQYELLEASVGLAGNRIHAISMVASATAQTAKTRAEILTSLVILLLAAGIYYRGCELQREVAHRRGNASLWNDGADLPRRSRL